MFTNHKIFGIVSFSICICFYTFSFFSIADASVSIRPAPTSELNAYWTFDAKTINWANNTISDISGNGNSGTLVNMSSGVNQVAGRRGQALFFDGNIDSISLSSNPLSDVADPSSMCAWVYNEDISLFPAGLDQTFLNLFTDNDNGIRVGSVVNTGTFFVSYRHGGTYYGGRTTSQVFLNDTWAHVCYVWDGVGITLYANGVSMSTTTNVYSLGSLNTIGAMNDLGDGTWSGSIDDLRVYSRALTASEILAIYKSGALVLKSVPNGLTTIATTPSKVLTNGLVGHWTFDGNKVNWGSNTVTDSSGNGRTGTLSNMSLSSSPIQGKVGQGMSFDGDNDIMTVADHDSLDLGPLTAVFWIKVRSHPRSYNEIMIKWESDANYMMYVSSAGNLCAYHSGGPSCSSFDFDDALDTWFHVAMAMTASDNTDIYINGVYHSSIAKGYNSTNNGPIYIGNYPFNEGLDGALDDVRLYNRILSAPEIKHLYGLGR